MAAVPNFVAGPRVGIALLSTANANRDGTGAVVSVLAAGPNGTRVDKLRAQALGTTTAGMVRFFIADGLVTRLFKEVPVKAVAASGSAEVFSASFSEATNAELLPIYLPAGHTLMASTEKGEQIVALAFGGDH